MRLPCATHSHVLGSHRRCPNGCTARKLGRHAACSVWHAENGTRQGCDEETETGREREQQWDWFAAGDNHLEVSTLLYYFPSRISCSHTHRHTHTVAHTAQFVLQLAAGQLSWPRVGLLWRSRLTTHLGTGPTPLPATF